MMLGMVCLMALAAGAQFTKAELHATGLTCAMCNNAINKALQALPFIQSVKSDIKNSSFHVVFRDGQEVNPDAMKKAVEDAGFSVGKLELYGNEQPLSVGDDKHVTIGKSVYHFVNVGDRQLNADTKLMIIDKDFISHKQFKKISASTKMDCIQTGKAGSCCTDAGVPENARVYHVTI